MNADKPGSQGGGAGPGLCSQPHRLEQVRLQVGPSFVPVHVPAPLMGPVTVLSPSNPRNWSDGSLCASQQKPSSWLLLHHPEARISTLRCSRSSGPSFSFVLHEILTSILDLRSGEHQELYSPAGAYLAGKHDRGQVSYWI